MAFKESKIVAEIGCNHLGKMDVAKEMLQTLKHFCKIKYVKFQKRTIKELLSDNEYNTPHPNPHNSYGDSYGKHREALEFTADQHRELKDLCDELDMVYTASVWDLTAAKTICSLNPAIIKIPSASNLRFDLLDYICNEFEGEIHLSFGMTTHKEEEEIINFIKERKRNKDLVIYSCTSGYPVPMEDLCLYEISRLMKNYGSDVKAVGFSGHHLGIAADVAALTLGAEWIERHFTLDRTWKGTDHAASLEPDGLRRLARDLRNINKALRYKDKEVLDIEQAQREKLKKYI